MEARSITLLFLGLLSAISVRCQDFPVLNFTHLTTRDGLSSDLALCVQEDRQGFIWIGTANGLNRYDGYRVKQYFHDENNPNSLPGNEVRSMLCDRHGRLWIATSQGASCFLPDSNRFINYTSTGDAGHRLGPGDEQHFYEDAAGGMWLLDNSKQLYEVKADLSLEPVRVQQVLIPGALRRLASYSVIVRDSAQQEWAFSGNCIYRLDTRTKQFIDSCNLSRQIGDRPIVNLSVDFHGTYWVTGYESGVWQFHPLTNEVTAVPALLPGLYRGPCEWESDGKKWLVFTKDNAGLYLVDPVTMRTKEYASGPRQALSLRGWQFHQVFADHTGSLWICSNNGVNRTAPRRRLFDIYTVNKPTGGAGHAFRTGMAFGFSDLDSIYWMNVRGVGTYVYSASDMQERKFYRSFSPLNATTVNRTSSIYAFCRKNNVLYISTDSGLMEYSIKDERIRWHFPGAFTRIADFRNIIPVGDHRLWIRSFGNGLFEYDLRKAAFTRHFAGSDSSAVGLPSILNFLLKTRSGKIFLAANQGILLEYDSATDGFIRHRLEMPGIQGDLIHPGNLYGMAEDQSGKLWICSRSGVCVYDPVAGRMEAFYSEGGQMGETYRICIDNFQNVWVNGYSGLWGFVRRKLHWVHLTPESGLPEGDFEGFLMRDRQNNIWCGLEDAVMKIYPAELLGPPKDIPVIITEAETIQKPVAFPLDARSVKRLVLQPGENSFTVDFAVLNYNEAQRTKYYYRLSPMMDFYQTNVNGHLNFNGLAPGEYRLEVRGGDKIGDIYSNSDVLLITVKPRFYETGWFKVLAVLLLLCVVGLVTWRVIRHIRKEAALRQKIISTEMMALRARMNPHFIFNCLNSIDNLIQADTEKATVYLAKFSRLIRAILEHSKKETIPCWTDVEALRLYLEMEELRLGGQFTWSIDVDPRIRNGDYHVPPLILQPFAENAIHHGLMNKVGGDKRLRIQVDVVDNGICYVVEDNGIGRIKAAEILKRNWPDHHSQGMEITKERIDYFNGEKSKSAVRIFDLYSDDGEPLGTRVEIWLNQLG